MTVLVLRTQGHIWYAGPETKMYQQRQQRQQGTDSCTFLDNQVLQKLDPGRYVSSLDLDQQCLIIFRCVTAFTGVSGGQELEPDERLFKTTIERKTCFESLLRISFGQP